MRWENSVIAQLRWAQKIENLDAKRRVGALLAGKVNHGDVIGFGSGSTSFIAIQAIAETLQQKSISCIAIPTSQEVSFACAALGIPTLSLNDAKPSWAFDGADEVDPGRNLIKGRGGAMFKEKLNIDSAAKNYILVDPSKLVKRLGERFPIPVEVAPTALSFVSARLRSLGAASLELRLGTGKDGPVITESGNMIIDARFDAVEPHLESAIKGICGVIESGLFQGRENLEILVAD
ncbi:ribose 5-phosphate isomerase A [Acidobacteria bacterium AB60]|nr:ribose 5-phosphate isomerase A [Acidobacteria bacterium AB60]